MDNSGYAMTSRFLPTLDACQAECESIVGCGAFEYTSYSQHCGLKTVLPSEALTFYQPGTVVRRMCNPLQV